MYHVSFKSYIYSLEGEGQLEHFVDHMVGNFSEGRSGGFFFTTADRRYLVKTIGRKERRRAAHGSESRCGILMGLRCAS